MVSTTVRYERCAIEDRDDVAEMTFPAFRHLLSLEPQPLYLDSRHSQGSPIQPMAVKATVSGVPIALALVSLPVTGHGEAELLSIFVDPRVRRRGIGFGLMKATTEFIAHDGFSSIRSVYMTGKPNIVAVEKIFWMQGWCPPDARMIVLRITTEDFERLPFWEWPGLRTPFRSELWIDVTDAALDALRRDDESEPWIPDDLKPWRVPKERCHPETSMALLRDDDVVGWVLTEKVGPDLLRYTNSYIRPEFWRRCHLMRLWKESFTRMLGTEFTTATLTSHARHPNMVGFIKRHIVPVVSFAGETRGTRRILASAPSATDRGARGA
jgi:GNAT superfamily N-acetyltransferase